MNSIRIQYRHSLPATALTLALLVSAGKASAGEIGHFAPGIANIRDFVMPEPGIYGVLYNYFYTTDRLNDSHGNKVESVTINSASGSSVTLGVNVDVDIYALVPTLIWVTDIKPLGMKYGAFIAPSFMNANLDAALSAAEGQGGNVDAGSFGAGDLFVQPIWLGKTTPHWDFALGYGFYAPVGKYDTETITLPVIGPVKTESSDNLGYGFWTHQIQGALAWYPFTPKTAVTAALTYEVNGKKEGFDLTPGDNLTLNWGISQLLPLKKDGSLLLEVGPAGYDTWQITDDSGSAANDTRDQVHAVGGQIGVTYAPWMLSLNFHGFYEYSAVDRFQGASFGLNISKKF
jgi:hypothetical protein